MATEGLGLPLLVFSGDIKYVLELQTADKLIEELMLTEGEFVVGFDIEWPVFTKENKTAVLQICCTEKEVYVFHLSSLGGLPTCLKRILCSKRVKKVGVNISGDMKKLERDFQIPAENIITNSILDLGKFANQILNSSNNWSLDGLTRHLLKHSLDKDPLIRTGDWSNIPLSDAQLRYAATDAYVFYYVNFD